MTNPIETAQKILKGCKRNIGKVLVSDNLILKCGDLSLCPICRATLEHDKKKNQNEFEFLEKECGYGEYDNLEDAESCNAHKEYNRIQQLKDAIKIANG